MSVGLVIVVVLFACFALTTPIAISLGLTSAVVVLQSDLPGIVIVQRLFTSIDSFPLMAVPFFILAGNLMGYGGISKRLIAFANTLVGPMTGGLGIVAIVACMFFAAVSGSGPATTAAIGGIMLPAMVARGYDVRFSSATIAAAGQLGVIIPPSIPMVLFGVAASASIGDLFLGGVVPGILIGVSLCLVMYVVSKQKGYAGARSYTGAERLAAGKDAFWALLMPGIILGGIYSGAFTPTEASVIATVYALFVGFFIYKELKLSDLKPVFCESAVVFSIIMILLSTAGLFGWVMAVNNIPLALMDWFSSVVSGPIAFFLLINVVLLFVGMFFDGGAAIIILAPMLTPVAKSFGIDPVHFGVVMVANLAMGFITPPFGVNLFVACELAKINMEDLTRFILVYVCVLLADLLIISYCPALTLWLPNMLR